MSDLSDAVLADAISREIDRQIEASAADMGIGTVTAVAPGGITGTVAVNIGTTTPIRMRHSATYTPQVADKVKWSRSRAGDWFVDYELA